MNDLYAAWIEQIYKRDTFYLYILAIVVAAILWYYGLKLWRHFRLVLLGLLAASAAGIVWGIAQL